MVKKIGAIALAAVLTLVFAANVYADNRGRGQHMRLFNEAGAEVNFQGGFGRCLEGDATFGRGCWYIDENGDIVSAFGYRIYDEYGNPVEWNRNLGRIRRGGGFCPNCP